MQSRICISLSPDTVCRLDQYAREHNISRSQAVSDMVWRSKIRHPQLSGQISMEEYLAKAAGRKGSSKAK